MFHHPQNIPSIIRTQRADSLKKNKIPSIIRIQKVDGTTRIFHHHHQHHHHQRWPRLQRSVPPLSLLVWSFWKSMKQHQQHYHHHLISLLVVWLVKPTWLGWNIICVLYVFLWELMAMKVCCKSLWYATWEIEREREKKNKTHHTQWSFKLSFWVWVLWMSIRVSVVGLILESHLFVGVGFCFLFCVREEEKQQKWVFLWVCVDDVDSHLEQRRNQKPERKRERGMAGATVMVRRSARLLAAATLGSRSPGTWTEPHLPSFLLLHEALQLLFPYFFYFLSFFFPPLMAAPMVF